MLPEKKPSSLLKKVKDSAFSFFSYQKKNITPLEEDTTSIDIIIDQKEKHHYQSTLFDNVYQRNDITSDW